MTVVIVVTLNSYRTNVLPPMFAGINIRDDVYTSAPMYYTLQNTWLDMHVSITPVKDRFEMSTELLAETIPLILMTGRPIALSIWSVTSPVRTTVQSLAPLLDSVKSEKGNLWAVLMNRYKGWCKTIYKISEWREKCLATSTNHQ